MYRTISILLIFGVCAVAAPVVADELDDNLAECAKVRAVVTRAIYCAKEDDADGFKRCFDPETYVSYRAGVKDKYNWYILATPPNAAETQASGLATGSDLWDAHPEWKEYYEVEHVHVLNNHAVAVSVEERIMPDPEKDKVYFAQHKTVHLLQKKLGQWKITHKISHVDDEQTSIPMRPSVRMRLLQEQAGQ